MEIKEVNENFNEYGGDQPKDERIAFVSVHPEKIKEVQKDITNKIKLLVEEKGKKEKEIEILENKIKNLLKISRRIRGEDETAELN